MEEVTGGVAQFLGVRRLDVMAMKIISPKWLWFGIGVAGFGYVYARGAHGAMGWPFAIILGLFFGVLVGLFIRRQTTLPPYRLVLRLANDDAGDSEDDKVFEKLHARFKSQLAAGTICKFDGFDIGGGYLWFYFRGLDGKKVRDEVLSLVSDCTFREGSYFEIDVTNRLPIPAV